MITYHRPLWIGLLLFAALLAGMAWAVAQCPPKDSAAMAAWAQAFGTLVAIVGGAGLVFYDHHLARQAEGQRQQDTVGLVMYLGAQLDIFAAQWLAAEPPSIKSFDIDELQRTIKLFDDVRADDFAGPRLRLAWLKLQPTGDRLFNLISDQWHSQGRRVFGGQDEGFRKELTEQRALLSAALERFQAAA